MFIFEHSLFANDFLDYVRRGTRNSKYFSEIDCLHDPIENEKGGANCVVKKNTTNSESHGFTPDFKIIVPFPR